MYTTARAFFSPSAAFTRSVSSLASHHRTHEPRKEHHVCVDVTYNLAGDGVHGETSRLKREQRIIHTTSLSFVFLRVYHTTVGQALLICCV